MRLYVRPELNIELFDVEDVITLSDSSPIHDDGDTWAGAPMPESGMEAADAAQEPKQATLYPYSTVEDASGAFQQQVTGGNPIQEGLNNLYENFLNTF